jgi:hypothetical protein
MSSLSLLALAQRAVLLLAVALAAALLAGALLAAALLAGALLVAGLLLVLLQPARTAAATAPAAHSALHPLAVMPAGCKTSVLAASPAPGEGQAPRRGLAPPPQEQDR